MSLKIVNELKPVTFKYNEHIKNDDGKTHMGFIAQDLLEQFGDQYAIVVENKENKYLMIRHNELIAPLVKAVQELSLQVDNLQKQINTNN
jgi:hypothetical protein